MLPGLVTKQQAMEFPQVQASYVIMHLRFLQFVGRIKYPVYSLNI